MADWSELPQELLALIAKRLETQFDVLRFRSVCSSWRSSFQPKVHPSLPKLLPSKTKGKYEYSLSRVSRNTVFLISLSGTRRSHDNQTEAPACWLVTIKEGNDREKMRLLKPLSDSELKRLPGNFPKVLDLTNFQVTELGHEYIGRYNLYIYHTSEDLSLDYIEKVVFLRSSTNSDDDFSMFHLFCYFIKYLAFLRSGEEEWTLLENVHAVQDIISFNGKFYAIERKGKTIVIDQSLNVSFLEHVGSPSSRRFLVKSVDNLLAVEMLFQASSDSDAESPVNYSGSFGDKFAGFRIFRMNEEEQKWDEMESLGDQILFLGLHQSISASASEFHWGQGNLIFYSAKFCMPLGYDIPNDELMCVFDLRTGTTIDNCSAYCNLFWPPPKWVTSPESVISSRQGISNQTHSVTSATPEIDPESNVASSTSATLREVVTSAGKEVGQSVPLQVPSAASSFVGSKRPSPGSKCSFKFCCF